MVAVRLCRACGGRMVQKRRTLKEWIKYASIRQCRDCGRLEYRDGAFAPFLSPVTRCPHCGTRRLHVLRRIDPIDKLYRTPLNSLQKILGGRLYHCQYCRLQFYDVRSLDPSARHPRPQKSPA